MYRLKSVSGGPAIWAGLLFVTFSACVGHVALDHLAFKSRATETVFLKDEGQLFDANERAKLRDYHSAILDSYDIDYRIMTVNNVNDLNWFAANSFEVGRVGGLSDAKRGLLLVISSGNRKVRLEVGRNLEGIYTDAFVSYIERQQLLPFFLVDRAKDGVLATTELIAARAAEAEAGLEFDISKRAHLESSTGAGATLSLDTAIKNQPTRKAIEPLTGANENPIALAKQYLMEMARGNADPNLPIYSEASRRMMANWVVTNAQTRMITETYSKCDILDAKLATRLAVVRYPVSSRQCAPFFFVREANAWRLDMTVMSDLVRFNHRNYWRFPKGPGPYRFAFQDWQFDPNGYPR